MKKSCLYFDKKYKCVSFIVHYKGLNLIGKSLGGTLVGLPFFPKSDNSVWQLRVGKKYGQRLPIYIKKKK